MVEQHEASAVAKASGCPQLCLLRSLVGLQCHQKKDGVRVWGCCFLAFLKPGRLNFFNFLFSCIYLFVYGGLGGAGRAPGGVRAAAGSRGRCGGTVLRLTADPPPAEQPRAAVPPPRRQRGRAGSGRGARVGAGAGRAGGDPAIRRGARGANGRRGSAGAARGPLEEEERKNHGIELCQWRSLLPRGKCRGIINVFIKFGGKFFAADRRAWPSGGSSPQLCPAPRRIAWGRRVVRAIPEEKAAGCVLCVCVCVSLCVCACVCVRACGCAWPWPAGAAAAAVRCRSPLQPSTRPQSGLPLARMARGIRREDT